MKKLLTVSLGLSIITSSLLATNGTQLIGFGAASRAMGGVGIATHFGAESALNNPALYSKQEKMEVTGGLTLFSPSVSYTDNGGKVDSDAGMSILPALSYAQKINDDMAFGVAMMSMAGMGVDYSGETVTNAAGMQDALSVLQFAAPFSYKYGKYSVGITPILQYSSLEMPSPTGLQDGSSVDFGVNLGFAYDYEAYTFGLLYKTAIESDYGLANPEALANPGMFGLGVNYELTESINVALDYKYLMYGSAAGFEDFQWDSQHVLAFGAEYRNDLFGIRLGANYGTDVIPSEGDDQLISNNLVLFPAVVAYHLTAGGVYDINENNTVDLTGVYGTGSQNRTVTSTYFDTDLGLDRTKNNLYKASNTQISITAQYTYHF